MHNSDNMQDNVNDPYQKSIYLCVYSFPILLVIKFLA